MTYATRAQARSLSGIEATEISNDDVDVFLAFADAEINRRARVDYTTGAGTSKTYHFTMDNDLYDAGYFLGTGVLGFDPGNAFNKDAIVLPDRPIKSLNRIRILNQTVSLDEVWSYDDSGSSYTDNTDEANAAGSDPFNVFAATPASSDIIYFGSGSKFGGLKFIYDTVGVENNAVTVVWEYYNGSSWTTISVTADTSTADEFQAQGGITWDLPSDWSKTTVNSGGSLYFIRARLSAGDYTTVPKLEYAIIDQDTSVSSEINLNEVKVDKDSAIIVFPNRELSTGFRKIRVECTIGVTSVPSYVQELAAYLTAERMLLRIMSESSENTTGYEIQGVLRIQKGEGSVDNERALRNIQKKIKELWLLVGDHFEVVSY